MPFEKKNTGDKEVYLVQDKRPQPTKKIGREANLIVTEENADKVKTFFADKKEMMLYVDGRQRDTMIMFREHQYVTSNPVEIDTLRNHPAFGNSIWEGEMPEWFIKKLKQDQDMMRRTDDDFRIPDVEGI
jgi:hypothetical protein